MANINEQGPDYLPGRPGPDASQSEVEADIARTREQLGKTLAQLVEKFDVKAQAEHTIEDIKDNAAGVVDEAGHKVTETLAAAKGAVQSVFSHDGAATYSAVSTGPDLTGEKDLVLRSRTDWVSLAPLAFASGLALTAAIVVVVWRR